MNWNGHQNQFTDWWGGLNRFYVEKNKTKKKQQQQQTNKKTLALGSAVVQKHF